MQNFTELLNRSLVNPLKERLASLQNANKENTKLREALAKELQAANVRQDKLESRQNELTKQLQAEVQRIDKIEQRLMDYHQSQNALISALEALKWNEGDETDTPSADTQSTSSCK